MALFILTEAGQYKLWRDVSRPTNNPVFVYFSIGVSLNGSMDVILARAKEVCMSGQIRELTKENSAGN